MTEQTKYSCRVCTRADLSLTANGRVRSHTADGKRRSETNPHCPGGSDLPKETAEPKTLVITSSGGPNPFRSPLPTGRLPQVQNVAGNPPETPRNPSDDFLSGDDAGDDDEGSGPSRPSYFPARYDGSCAACGSDFGEGDMIRKGPDGWEAEDCCGEDAFPQPEKPKAVAKTLPVKNGRYQFPHPETGLPTSGARASKFGETIADSIALDEWRGRMTVLGMALRPDLVDKAGSVVKGDKPADVAKAKRDYLNKIAQEARETAGDRERSRKGTILHKYTEELDGGTRTIDDVPGEYHREAKAYLFALESAGFRPVRSLIERSVYCSELGVTGTFDRVLECIRDQNQVDVNGRPTRILAGQYVIGDVKSGTTMKYPWMEIQIQMALYAHALNENGIAVHDPEQDTWQWSSLAEQGIKNVREDVGIVMHVPYGEGRCDLLYPDLVMGWRGAKLCRMTLDFRKESQLPKTAVIFSVAPANLDPELSQDEMTTALAEARRDAGFDRPSADQLADHPSVTVQEAPIGQSADQWEERFAAVTTKNQALDLYRSVKDRMPADEIKRLVMIGRVALAKAQELVSEPPVPAPISVVQPEPPARPDPQSALSWHQRAEAVTSKTEASKLFQEARQAVMTNDLDMDVTRLNELVVTMRKALERM